MTGLWLGGSAFNPFAAAQFNASLTEQFASDPMLMAEAAGMLQQTGGMGLLGLALGSVGMGSPFGMGGMPMGMSMGMPCGCGMLPQPTLALSGAPAGRGLTQNPPGFPAGSVRTAGGYTVVPSGNGDGHDHQWAVYGPNQQPGDTPMTTISGDPHVRNGDGGGFDFSRSSDFTLPDGTQISCTTSQEDGHSYSQGLDITNGADHVSVTGLDSQTPTTSGVMTDGFDWRAAHDCANPGRDNYMLGGTADHQQWYLQQNGQMQGQVTGSHYDDGTGSYQQEIDPTKQYSVDPSLQPPFGSAAWGNQLRSQITDMAGRMGDPNFAAFVANSMSWDDLGMECVGQGMMPMLPFGGMGAMGSPFAGLDQGLGSIGFLGDTMISQMAAQAQLLALRRSSLAI